MKKLIIGVILLVGLLSAVLSTVPAMTSDSTPQPRWWHFQAIDTMKFSRDPSREFLQDLPTLQKVAEQQTAQIATSGATHIAIATPYDEEFAPIMKTWVETARKHNLKIWFRGNWSGWEGWFGYQKITRAEHQEKTMAFIKNNPQYFEDGDVFSACPECENGGPGDPRLNNDAAGHRRFLISEYNAMKEAFAQMNKAVAVNFNSMNGDVAELIMDKPTTQALGGLVVVDHYVRSAAQLNQDITDLAQRSGGQVVLGEWGAPIPDIHGNMTPAQQNAWLAQALNLLADNPHLVGLSYWTNVGGSTALWSDEGAPKPGVATLKSYYAPQHLSIHIKDSLGGPVENIELQTSARYLSSADGAYQVMYRDEATPVTITATNFQPLYTTVAGLLSQPEVRLTPTQPDLWYRIRLWVSEIF